MGRKKSYRYKDVRNRERVLFPALCGVDPICLKPSWPVDLLKPEQGVVLELGCGKGEYTLALAERYPEKNFIGVDLKSDRLWVAATKAMEKGLENVWFVRARIDHLSAYFPKNFAEAIWIPFPDPAPGNHSGRKRLTSPRFLEIYRDFLKPCGIVRCKTDHEGLYSFTLDNLFSAGARLRRAVEDLHASDIDDPDIVGIESHFEKEFRKKGISVKFMEFYLE
ncbi:tRNA (guanosine(46)-N7)-methyltransferase TrmB [Desulfobotulus sp. H1]|uniref:tRNA (guanine-N(7)-)-methyltransferase n=1 Tax=Desulfobotulus pelophilus TaxID=2823377 RepID=A0ABT3N5W0_9BACT|nr:tRNA (guanosine(46)-N7)-methyltransferase TrmB [Desulfobotulus pelophilus]